MKTILLLAFVVLAVTVNAQTTYDCYSSANDACSTTTRNGFDIQKSCNAIYGGIVKSEHNMQEYANHLIAKSFEYLMMSTHFGNYKANRHGFESLFRKMSDDKWEGAMDMIKHISQRGGKMAFKATEVVSNHVGNELEAIAKALDIEKKLAMQANVVHSHASRGNTEQHDPEITSFIEETFLHKLSDNIRHLSGHAADLTSMLKESTNSSLSIYLFDEYLAKSSIM